MTRPNPIALDDEDPFADSFADFDAAPEAPEAPHAAEGSHAAAFDAEAEAEAPADPLSSAESVDAPVQAPREAPFDWFASFPRRDAAKEEATPPDAPADAAPESDAAEAPFPEAEAFSGLDDGFGDAPEALPAVELLAAGTDAEPEALPEAPSVPAAFDDALTEAAPFGLLEPEDAPSVAEPAFEPVFEPAAEPAPANPVAEIIASAEAALGETMAPRIAIHVFAQRPDTAAVAQTAATDRRLQRASTAVRPGGLPEALALYATSPTPALVIVENTAPAMQLLADLDRLAEVCDPGTKVVVIGEANDIGLYRELMRRGVSEYLVPPLNPLQLIRTITGLYDDPSTPFVGRTIAFVGAKGGVGASTLAHNFAWCLSERIEAQACVVDYDLPFGTAGLDFNQDPVQGLHDALEKPDRLDATLIDRMLARCTERLSLFAAPATLDDDYDIPADAYEEVANKIRSTAPFMVLDLPHVWSGWMRKTLLGADEVVLVAQPDLASLRNAKNLVELITKARPNDAPPRLVLNQVGLPGRPEIPIKDFSKALGMEPALVVPFDAKLFGQAANNGQMIGEVNPKAKAADALLQFAQAVTRREAAAAKPKSLVERLLKGG